MENKNSVFPSPSTIYHKEIVLGYNKKTNNININNNYKHNKKIFAPKQRSRFSFVNNLLNSNNSTNDTIEIPDYISEFIVKRVNDQMKEMKTDEEINYFNKSLSREFSKNCHWAKFILSHTKNLSDETKELLKEQAKMDEIEMLKKFNSA